MTRYVDFKKQNRLILLFKILSNANRFKIIKYLAERPSAHSGEIARELKISENNLSNHLKLMRISKVVRARQKASFMHYSIKDPLAAKLALLVDQDFMNS